jgi:hypothetical protein
MVWAKTPVAAASVLCAACLAMTAALPAVETAAERAARIASENVSLSAVNFGALDAFDAIPSLQQIIDGQVLEGLVGLDSTNAVPSLLALLTGNPAGLDGLDSTNGINPLIALLGGDTTAFADLASTDGIPALQQFVDSGGQDLTAFRPDEDGNGGYQSLSALPEYQDLLNGTPEQQTEALGRLDSVSGVPSLLAFAATGGNPVALGGIDAFSALPAYDTIINSDDVAERADAVRGLAAFSAIPEYLGLPSVPPPTSSARVAPQVQIFQAPVDQSGVTDDPVTPAAGEDGAVSTAVTVGAPETATPKKKTGSYSGVFKPDLKLPILFGSGSGSGADNGIRGWDKVVSGVKDAISGKKPSAPSKGGDNAGGGDAGGGDGGS